MNYIKFIYKEWRFIIIIVKLYKNPYLYILATVLLLAPHVLGAPIQHSIQGSIIPAELAAKFSTVSIGVNFIFWLMLGGLSAHFFKKFQPKIA